MAANKLLINIALEGGKEIERQLGDLGKAGETAFKLIGAAAEEVGGFKNLDVKEVQNQLVKTGVLGEDAINRILNAVKTAGRFETLLGGLQDVQSAFKNIGQAVKLVTTILGPLGIAFGAIAGKVTEAVTSTIKMSEAIGKVSAEAIKLHTSVEQLDRLRLGLERAGISAQNINPAIKQFGDELEKLGIDRRATTEMLPQLVRQLQGMPDDANRSALAIRFFGEAVGVELIQNLRAGRSGFDQFVTGNDVLTQRAVNNATNLRVSMNQATSAWERLRDTSGSPLLIASLDLATAALLRWQKAQQDEQKQSDEWARQKKSAFDVVTETLARWWETIKTEGAAAWKALGQAIDDWVVKPVKTLFEWLGKVVTKLKQLLGLGQQVGSAGGENPVTGAGQSFARGGPIGGRGSGTSDSNLAWVSRGEHIMPARAVAQPGVLAFLEALRRSGGNLRHVLDGMGRFALGGPVTMPALAGRGIGGMSNVTIQFPGLQPIGGLRAPAGVVDELRKAAAMAQVRSGGTKPSRYR